MSKLLDYCLNSVSYCVLLNAYNDIDVHIQEINRIFIEQNIIKNMFFSEIIDKLEKKFPSLKFTVNVDYISENIMSEFINFEWNNK